MLKRRKETQRLLEVSRQNLEEAQDKAGRLTIRKNRLERLVKDIAVVLNAEGQGTIVDRYDKIKMLVDDYQSNN